jgi:aminoglycoside 6'-N-acetyltransferase I
MNIIKVTQDAADRENFNDWLNLALQLWPDCSIDDLIKVIQSPCQAGFLVRTEDKQVFGSAVPEAIALMNLSLRYDFVPDATQSPVAYVEGIYVKAEYRQQGVGTALLQYAEQWALEQGCIQLALDAFLDNPASHKFYAKVGFREVERVVFFIKSVGVVVGEASGDENIVASPEEHPSMSKISSLEAD